MPWAAMANMPELSGFKIILSGPKDFWKEGPLVLRHRIPHGGEELMEFEGQLFGRRIEADLVNLLLRLDQPSRVGRLVL